MTRLRDRLKKPRIKINWGNPPMLQKHVVDPSPCIPCAYFIPRSEHNIGLLVDICICPERIKQMKEGWTIANRLGPKCKDWDKGEQRKLSEFE